jgi:hypothetical protein
MLNGFLKCEDLNSLVFKKNVDELFLGKFLIQKFLMYEGRAESIKICDLLDFFKNVDSREVSKKGELNLASGVTFKLLVDLVAS